MTQRLVIVGHGMAATRLTEALLAYKCSDIAITLIGEEPQLAYNRIQLSPVLGGEKTFAHTLLHPRQWYTDHGVTVLSGERVLTVDATRRRLTTCTRILEWDELVLPPARCRLFRQFLAVNRRMCTRFARWRMWRPSCNNRVRWWCLAAAYSAWRQRQRYG